MPAVIQLDNTITIYVIDNIGKLQHAIKPFYISINKYLYYTLCVLICYLQEMMIDDKTFFLNIEIEVLQISFEPLHLLNLLVIRETVVFAPSSVFLSITRKVLIIPRGNRGGT